MTSVLPDFSISVQAARFRRVFLLMAVSMAFTALPLLGQHPSFDITEEGRELSQAFNAGDLEAVVERFTPAFLELMGGEPDLQLYREQTREQFGQEVEMVSEEVLMEGDLHIYHRRARYDGTEGLVDMRWSLDIEGRVAAFMVVAAPVDSA
jgi:hypothetical protein